jgi:tripartite ATP-independent transporter DctP family solute receptor
MRALSLTLAIVLALCAWAAPAAAEPAAASREAVRLRLAELHPADHPTAKADYEFARLVRERSGGRILIFVYADSSLGQEMEVLEQLRFGGIDIARVSLAALSAYAPALEALQMPFLYRDEEHMWKVLKGELGKELLSSIGAAGFVGLGWYEAGARSFYDSRRPLVDPSDLAGLKIRVQEGGVMGSFVTALGAKSVPLAFGETYAAILRGSVDGAENNYSSYYSSRHYQVAKYFTLTEHVRIPEVVVGSAASFSELSAADRELIALAAMDSIEYQRAAWREYEAMAERRLREAGVEIRALRDPAAWRAYVRPLYDALDPATKALVERIRAVK